MFVNLLALVLLFNGMMALAATCANFGMNCGTETQETFNVYKTVTVECCKGSQCVNGVCKSPSYLSGDTKTCIAAINPKKHPECTNGHVSVDNSHEAGLFCSCRCPQVYRIKQDLERCLRPQEPFPVDLGLGGVLGGSGDPEVCFQLMQNMVDACDKCPLCSRIGGPLEMPMLFPSQFHDTPVLGDL